MAECQHLCAPGRQWGLDNLWTHNRDSLKWLNKAAWPGNCRPSLFFFFFFLHGVSNSIIEVEQVTRCSHPLNVSSSPCQGQRSSHKCRSSAPTHRWRGRWQAGEQRSSLQTLGGEEGIKWRQDLYRRWRDVTDCKTAKQTLLNVMSISVISVLHPAHRKCDRNFLKE